MKIQDVLNALEQFAPLPLQDEWDNSGLQVGLTEEQEVAGALLCLDVTPEVVNEAILRGANLIISHHPLLFEPPRSITRDTYTGGILLDAIRSGIAIYSAHTNLDKAQGGINTWLAEALNLRNIRPLLPNTDDETGHGAIGQLPNATQIEEVLQSIKAVCQTSTVKYAATKTHVQTIAVCGGSGAKLIDIAKEAGADLYLTGEKIAYNDYLENCQQIALVEAGHYQTERQAIDILYNVLHQALPNLKLYKSEINTNPIKYI